MNTAHERVLRYFEYGYPPGQLQEISQHFYVLAHNMVESLEQSPDPAEVTVGLRKLLEAKDCFARAMVK